MTTVYLVTHGSYSDYRIDAAFLDKAKAERYCAIVGTVGYGNKLEIEVWDTESGEPLIAKDLHWYSVFVNTSTYMNVQLLDEPPNPMYARWTICEPATYADGMYARVYLQARDAAHAVKIVNDERRLILASNLWKVGPVPIGKVIDPTDE